MEFREKEGHLEVLLWEISHGTGKEAEQGREHTCWPSSVVWGGLQPRPGWKPGRRAMGSGQPGDENVYNLGQ